VAKVGGLKGRRGGGREGGGEEIERLMWWLVVFCVIVSVLFVCVRFWVRVWVRLIGNDRKIGDKEERQERRMLMAMVRLEVVVLQQAQQLLPREKAHN